MSEKLQVIESGERHSFFNLFKNRVRKLEVPIIQRDYAQGRESSDDVRQTFLEAIYQYLDENKPSRDLDFVYGSVNGSADPTFVPLDGQQRLTTLFLLHWYLASLSSNQTVLRNVLTEKVTDGQSGAAPECRVVSRFTYETRASSREFCDALLKNDIDLGNLLQPEGGKGNGLSRTIRDQGWYYLSWDHDPTIQSMLTMLDAIHARFAERPDFFHRLTSDADPVITFLYLDLKHFHLSDDLYIKMNSRGKALTTFENFKAKVEQHIGTLDWGDSVRYQLKHQDKTRQVSPKEYFSFMIDTAWADLFWNYRELAGNAESLDDELMSFIRTIITNQYAADLPINDIDNLDFLIGTSVARKRRDYSDDISFQRFKSFGSLTKEAVALLISAFDTLANGDSKIRIHLANPDHFDEETIFRKVLLHDLSLRERVCFHAYIKYLISNRGNSSGLSDWMRVIHNLTENRDFDGALDVRSAIRSVDGLVQHGNAILTFLKGSSVKIEFFTGRQVQEERIKAHLLSKSQEWAEYVKQIERHKYFDGQIGFILEFSGILEYFEVHDDCSWPEKDDEEWFNTFRNYAEKASAAFDLVLAQLKTPEHDRNYLWERAVLVKGDYPLYASAHRYNLLNSNQDPRYTWKRLLRLPAEDTTYWKDRRSYVKSVFDDPLFDVRNINGSLENICNARPDDWRKYLIQNPKLIRYCKQGFIRYDEAPIRILLYRQSQQNHRHREMFTYYMFLTWLKDSPDFPGFEWDHKVVKGGDEESYAETEEWSYGRKHYLLSVRVDDQGSGSTNPQFVIGFRKTRGSVKQPDIATEIAKVLVGLRFKWNDERDCYERCCKTEQKTITILKTVSSSLHELNAS